MINIRVLPTDKPSRTYKIDSIGKLDWSEGYLHQVDGATNQNIYITSDEEIKDGDWFLNTLNGTIDKCEDIISQKNVNLSSWLKKIILTTDQDLIKNGVQAIDDDFLQWFVENPSCEEIGVIKEQYHQFVGNTKLPLKPNYKIIIPV
jgi:hypothetical protein